MYKCRYAKCVLQFDYVCVYVWALIAVLSECDSHTPRVLWGISGFRGDSSCVALCYTQIWPNLGGEERRGDSFIFFIRGKDLHAQNTHSVSHPIFSYILYPGWFWCFGAREWSDQTDCSEEMTEWTGAVCVTWIYQHHPDVQRHWRWKTSPDWDIWWFPVCINKLFPILLTNTHSMSCQV